MDNLLTLYSGADCHLCEQAKELLYPVIESQGWRLRTVNIGGDDELIRRYGTRIPVVVLPDGQEKGWPFSAGQIRRLLVSGREQG